MNRWREHFGNLLNCDAGVKRLELMVTRYVMTREGLRYRK